ncbi:MAG TPA: quinone-dependent dihydroorotate dehydrogenase [Bdellovibrionales bacterium]|nr:quinone-dependent dihydroorotate dehydrogenase [Bdellovibrionales bacterium]
MKPWFLIPVQRAHDWAPFFINTYARLVPKRELVWSPLEWRGLRFRNRLGIAGGVDKDAIGAPAWIKLGAGFVEIGTVTPLPQGPNPGPTVGRDLSRLALWNKLGFPSQGARAVKERLQSMPRTVPVFVNIGKNRDTPNENAANDYVSLVKEFEGLADAFVVNISSPNTKNLRDLQQTESLRALLNAVLGARGARVDRGPANEISRTPTLLKLSPDVSDAELEGILQTSYECGIDGWILTNTTRERPAGSPFPHEGGLSGKPLAGRSKHVLARTLSVLGSKKEGRLLISAGGIMTAGDVRERLDMGADLVQVYSALIFSGPGFFRSVARVLGDRK